ncbi:50S ribosomal protein L14 [Candidatus Woesebacteria bacterium CG_4_10_14_0_2_um_filter_39_14]|uniref:Large ribosomal subunit protein uL14 n=3 Tax=Microgenomates group TaxID=1794810 RepID=A0A2M6YPT1_9BACT|nr:MAG: 50S ribosomal protein L14 [Candidatus Shapirobacteria bacterium CG07_land_8_20_14_0_80_39_12]PIZ49097.1 MAG: 50S ribosomal protein L14 [Candidatus Woesebacteria bacterium CG_4_10_14_0_2_um_filter_39_14]PJA49258.1 MAG: 50S ribosomal protein L14 [Candidatus Shapirobacteria bacterium CG_4_9_14_3_um_filter_39_13]
MIQLRSILKPADNTGAKRLMVIHLYGGSKRKRSKIGDIILAVVDQADPKGIVKDKDKVRALIVRTRKELRRIDGSYIRFDDNAAIIIDKDGIPLGTRVFGPIAREIKEAGYAKIVSLAEEVI